MAGSVDAVALAAAVVRPGSPWAAVEHHATIGSTNARAVEVGRPWYVVVSDHQSAGRGRLTRTWEAPPGASLAVSAVVPLPAYAPGWLPLLTGLAVAEAVTEVTGLAAEVKWPNDVLLPTDVDRKVCGVLCEVLRRPAGDLVVVGAGVNLTQRRDQLPVDTATSLALAGAGDVDRVRLVAAYLERLAARAGEGPTAAARAAYADRCATLGREVVLSRPGAGDVTGRAVAVDDEGRLVVDTPTGRSAWAAGDVTHVRPPR